ncbi:MAG: superoxide dismutase [Alphaproteobacteria bacterium]|nr:superoxide dismutase [Alphaproteobacteria bacterium]
MTFELPPLPFSPEALEPHISARTLAFHHGKHHQTYVTNLNNLIKGKPLESASLEGVVRLTAQEESQTAIFNNAAQVWNHAFFWNSLSPQGKEPKAELMKKLEKDFGGLTAFKEQFKQKGLAQFGSGWVWLVEAGGKLQITKTANAVNPLVMGQKPLLTCDVWEHAYYLDYQNRRGDFLEIFLNQLVNWDFVAQNLGNSAG